MTTRTRALRALAAVPVLASLLMAGSAGTAQADTTGPDLTAYRGGGSGGVAALQTYETWSGTPVRRALDFTPDDTWTNIEGPSWLLNAWKGKGKQLTLSVPLFPKPTSTTTWSLAACARGDYDSHYAALGRNLVSYQLPTTVVRPGWEFNGDWFHWKGVTSPSAFAGCFRHVVTTMRSVPGQAFSFDWNPNVGPGQFPAEQAWPGDGYVTTVGVDAYDTSWAGGTYPIAATATAAERLAVQQKTWDAMRWGDHGLQFWSTYAQAHGARLSLPEWGLSVRPDGHGGGDNPYYVQQMLKFIKEPSNGVAWASYFDYNSGDGLHQISGTGTPFPTAQAAYLTALRATDPVPTVQAPVVPVQLLSSATGTRTPAVALDGTTVKGSLYAFVPDEPGIARVAFYVDDASTLRTPARVELAAPWDLGGGTATSALPYGLAALAPGAHTLTVVVNTADGAPRVTTSTFTVTL